MKLMKLMNKNKDKNSLRNLKIKIKSADAADAANLDY